MAAAAGRGTVESVRRDPHRQLCTIELIAEGHAGRCPGEACPFWDHGCALQRVEAALDGRPDVARILLDLRRELEGGKEIALEDARMRLAHILNVEAGIESEDGPEPPAA